MNLEIQSWYGRLGNNMMQLCNILLIAQKKRYNITYIPEHPILNISHIPKKWLKNSNYSFDRTFKGYLFNKSEVTKLLKSTSLKTNDYISIFKKVIFPILKPEVVPHIPFDDNTIVIHIRSGDCFQENKINPHPKYVPLPLSYYIKAIDDFCQIIKKRAPNQSIHVIIVTENDKINPVIHEIKKYITNNLDNTTITIQSCTLEKDIKTILSAQNLILSIGYFSKLLGILSPFLKNIWVNDYLSGYQDFENLIGVDVNTCHIQNYIEKGEWVDTPVQRDLILRHNINDVIITKKSV